MAIVISYTAILLYFDMYFLCECFQKSRSCKSAYLGNFTDSRNFLVSCSDLECFCIYLMLT